MFVISKFILTNDKDLVIFNYLKKFETIKIKKIFSLDKILIKKL